MNDEEAMVSDRHEWACASLDLSHPRTINERDAYAAGYRAGLARARHFESSENTEDDDPSNMLVRAGYLFGLALRLKKEDREMVQQAARSLLHAARKGSRDA